MRELRRVVIILAMTISLATTAPRAWGSFTSSPSPPSMQTSTATLSAASGLGTQNVNCVALTSTKVKLTWTATSSTWADGYDILRSVVSGGPYTSIGTVSGQSTVTFTDATPLFLTTYYYVVQAKKQNWRSVNTAQASITTPTVLCA